MATRRAIGHALSIQGKTIIYCFHTQFSFLPTFQLPFFFNVKFGELTTSIFVTALNSSTN